MSPAILSGMAWTRLGSACGGKKEPGKTPKRPMKKAFLIVLALVIVLAIAGLSSSCTALAGTQIGIGEQGVTITPPPARPIVIPAGGK